jgi:hypothetical protein
MLLCGWQLGTLQNSCFNLAKEHGLPLVQAIATGLASTPGELTESGDGQAHSTLDTFAMPSMSRNRVYSLGNVVVHNCLHDAAWYENQSPDNLLR